MLNDTFRYMEPFEQSMKGFSADFAPESVTNGLPQQYGGHHEVSIFTDPSMLPCMLLKVVHPAMLHTRIG